MATKAPACTAVALEGAGAGAGALALQNRIFPHCAATFNHHPGVGAMHLFADYAVHARRPIHHTKMTQGRCTPIRSRASTHLCLRAAYFVTTHHFVFLTTAKHCPEGVFTAATLLRLRGTRQRCSTALSLHLRLRQIFTPLHLTLHLLHLR